MDEARQLIQGAYLDFNARCIDAVLARMQPDVVWPNGMEGGYVYGHGGVRAYWTRQWETLDPHVEPVEFREEPGGRIVVNVHQVVKDREGKLLADSMVRHIYRLREGLIAGMEIEQAG